MVLNNLSYEVKPNNFTIGLLETTLTFPIKIHYKIIIVMGYGRSVYQTKNCCNVISKEYIDCIYTFKNENEPFCKMIFLS